MRTILMDGDPGHDDVIAFLMALGHPERFRIRGFTTVAGNSTAKNCTGNILKVMDYLGVSVPVAAGYETPLVRPLDTAAKYHGETGLDGLLAYPPAVSKPLGKHAVEFLKETILASEEKITLVTMGPLTLPAGSQWPLGCTWLPQMLFPGRSTGPRHLQILAPASGRS